MVRIIFRLTCWLAVLLLTACGGGDGGGGNGGSGASNNAQTGVVSGTVIALDSGQPVANATVNVGSTSVATGADGRYSVAAAASDRLLVKASAAGFGQYFGITSLAAGANSTLTIRLLASVSTSVSGSAGGVAVDPNSPARVELPANALISANGAAPTGNVTVALTPIDPAADVSRMPGDFTSTNAATGTTTQIESFGALGVEIRDANGTEYNLAAGKSAIIRIPLSTRGGLPPSTIPLYHFDESLGRWVEEGSATLMGAAPDQYYEGIVTHFSFWNADKPMETVFVNGCVRDANNQPVAGVFVRSEGLQYTGYDWDQTDASGIFRVGIRKDSLASIAAVRLDALLSNEPSSNAVTVGPSAVEFTLGACLTFASVSPLAIVSGVLPSTVSGQPYSFTLTANGGSGQRTWSISSGSLPAGLTLNSSTGAIAGTTNQVGTYQIGIRVADQSLPVQSVVRSFQLIVNAINSGGSTGSLTVSNAPAAVGGSFEPDQSLANPVGTTVLYTWTERRSTQLEQLQVLHDSSRGSLIVVSTAQIGSGSYIAACGVPSDGSSVSYPPCAGVTIDRSAGTVTFSNVGVLNGLTSTPIVLNGALTFTPF